MKKVLILASALSFVFFSCEDDDVTAVTDNNNFSIATATYESDYNVNEQVGELNGTVSLSKPVNTTTTFSFEQVGGTAVVGEDYTVSNFSIPSFGTSTTYSIGVVDNEFPQSDRTLSLKLTTPEFGTELLNPNSNVPYTIQQITITDVNPEGVVNIGLAWNHDDASDLDMFVFDSNGNPMSIQATGDDPEIAVLIDGTFPDGTYYLNIDAYTFYNQQIGINFGLSDGAGNVTEYSGTYDLDNLDQYGSDYFAPWGIDTYRMVEINKSGTNYTFTKLF